MLRRCSRLRTVKGTYGVQTHNQQPPCSPDAFLYYPEHISFTFSQRWASKAMFGSGSPKTNEKMASRKFMPPCPFAAEGWRAREYRGFQYLPRVSR